MKYCTFILILAATLVSGSLQAQVPKLVNYQGRVAVNGVNFDGTGQFKFALVSANGSVTYWSNNGTSNGGSEPSAAVPLTVTQGLYSLLLGDTALGANMTTIPSTVFSNPDVRLRVWFNDGAHGSQLLTPDQRLAPATYLADGTVTSASVGNAAITTGKIAAGAVNNTNIAPGSLDSTIFAVPGAPNAGQVLGFNGTGLTWTAPGGGVFSLNGTSAYYNGGNVGIGTNIPATKLQVNTASGTSGFTHTAGAVTLGSYIGGSGSGATGGWLGTFTDDPLHLFVNNGSQPAMTVSKASSIGIGTFSPQAKLHLYDPGSVTDLIETGGGTNSWAQVKYKNASGEWVTGTSRGFQGDAYYIDRPGNAPIELLLSPNGNLGLGIVPQAKLDIYDAGSVVERISTGGGTNAYTQIQFANGNGQWDIGTSRNYLGDQLYFAREGSANIPFSIQPNGDAFLQGTMSCKVLTIRGADVAEPFDIAEQDLPKGTVVVIDEKRLGGLKRSTNAYDRRVAGIVSGANGINSGIILSQPGVNEGGQNVAISGRVYVQADATNESIEPGDMLTTSDTPGYAMKVTEHARAQGAVIGKAMSALDEGKGMVLVLVTLQ